MAFYLFLTVAYLVAYVAIIGITQLLFARPIRITPKLVHLVIIFSVWVASLLIVYATHAVFGEEVANRVLHGLSGGVVASLIVVLAAGASKVPLSLVQLLLLNALLVMCLGVANELLEALLQWTTPRNYAYSISDTWYDLYSNLAGVLIVSVGLIMRRAVSLTK